MYIEEYDKSVIENKYISNKGKKRRKNKMETKMKIKMMMKKKMK